MPSREHPMRQLVGSRARGSVGCAISCFPGAPLLAPSHRSLSAGSSAVDTATAAAAARRVGKRPAGPDCTLQNQRRRLNDGASTTSTSPRRQLTLQQAVPPPGLPVIRAAAPAEPSGGLQVEPDVEDGSGGDDEPQGPAQRQNQQQRQQQEARDRAEALHRRLSDRSMTIGVSQRATQGIQPWSRGSGRDNVKVQFVRLDEPKVRKLDGSTTDTTTTGEQIRFEQLKFGTTVLEYGKGGMKTVRANEFAVERSRQAIVDRRKDGSQRIAYVTPRRNLAMKLATDLRELRIDVHNYLEIDGDVSVAKWCDHDVIIISGEQVHKLAEDSEGMDKYKWCTLIIDEFVTLASSFGGSTMWWPMETMNALAGLARVSTYLILMDADVSIDGKAEEFIKGIAPMRDVRHFQSTRPAMERTLFLAFSGIKADKRSYLDRLELSLHRSRKARLDGSPNRTFFGGTTVAQVTEVGKKATEMGVANVAYHGKMSEITRKEHFRDADLHMEPHDCISANTVMAIGTDLSLKCSCGFFETARGCPTHGVASMRMLNQLMGRPGRDVTNPLDGLTVDGVPYHGAMFVLVDGMPKSLDKPSPPDGHGSDRVTRKFKAARADGQKVLDACAAETARIVREYDERNGITVVGDDGSAERVSLHTKPPSIDGAVKEIMAWNDVERRDNYEAHVEKNLELWKLPTSGYTIRPLPPLSREEKAELDAFRQQPDAAPIMTDADREVSEMGTKDQYAWVQENITDEPGFWEDCNGLCPKLEMSNDGKWVRKPQPETDARGVARKRVFFALKHLKEWVDPDSFVDLDGDKDAQNIYNRALMRFVRRDDIVDMLRRAQQTGHMGQAEVQASLPAANKMPLLEEFARTMKLQVDAR